mmetsp:Transcript_90024/g.226483  ORF Transcript_90024/g.226483 Transcript_90024/m.226483 type:complete len:134 (+) Transcript_90024:1218-1619(+)
MRDTCDRRRGPSVRQAPGKPPEGFHASLGSDALGRFARIFARQPFAGDICRPAGKYSIGGPPWQDVTQRRQLLNSTMHLQGSSRHHRLFLSVQLYAFPYDDDAFAGVQQASPYLLSVQWHSTARFGMSSDRGP